MTESLLIKNIPIIAVSIFLIPMLVFGVFLNSEYVLDEEIEAHSGNITDKYITYLLCFEIKKFIINDSEIIEVSELDYHIYDISDEYSWNVTRTYIRRR